MLHARQVVLRDRIQDVADEELMIGMALRQQGRAVRIAKIRGFDDGNLGNVVSLTGSIGSWFR